MILKKFKENNKFVNVVTEFEISKTTMNFKIDIVNFIDKYPKMKKSCISLFYLKNNFRIIFFIILKLTDFKPILRLWKKVVGLYWQNRYIFT